MNETEKTSIKTKIYNLTAGRRKWLIAGVSLAAVVVLALVLASSKTATPTPSKTMSTFKARRDNLTVTVTESGSIKARKSTDLKSEVEGRATIINIVAEGSIVSPEDVCNGKVLVELDSGDLKEQLSQRQIDFTSADASFAQAKEAYDIQVKQNESDISAAELKVKFALMDFQKYLGETLANQIIKTVDDANDPNSDVTTLIDITGMLNDPNKLGGQAAQKLDDLKNSILLADEELKKAQNTLDWTIRLREKEYVSETDLQTDRLTVESLEIKYGQAKVNLQLYKDYDFSKDTQKLLSDYYESKRNLERTYAKARAQLAQATAQLESAKSRLDLQRDRLDKSKKQFAACTMKAPAPGLVVYGSSMEPMNRFRGSGLIAPGETVFQRQTIITLPDTSEMMAEITVHESSVDKVKSGQNANIVMDAFPDQVLHGQVIKVAPLPDQQRNWLSPDIKVYATQVSIEGTHNFLKPGMSARVEILVDQVNDTLIVPVQVVANRGGKKICFVVNGGQPVEREVKTGLFNDTFVQIADGLQAGDEVLLNPPRITETKTEPAKQFASNARQPQQPSVLAQAAETRPAIGDSNGPSQVSSGPLFDSNRPDDQPRDRTRQFADRTPRGDMPFDPNQMDEQTRERIRQFRERAQRGELDPNQMNEQSRERFRQNRNRMRDQSDGASSRQTP